MNNDSFSRRLPLKKKTEKKSFRCQKPWMVSIIMMASFSKSPGDIVEWLGSQNIVRPSVNYLCITELHAIRTLIPLLKLLIESLAILHPFVWSDHKRI